MESKLTCVSGYWKIKNKHGDQFNEWFKNTLKIKADESLLTKVAKGLGPAIYNADASKVSGSSKKELETVKKTF